MIKYYIIFIVAASAVDESLVFLLVSTIYIVISVLRKILFSNKKLVITKRLVRYITMYSVLSLYLFIQGHFHLLLLVFIVTHAISYPIEKSIYIYFKTKAKKVLENYNGKIIAITGSYGKTTTKYYLKQILSQKHSVLMSDKSYNTPMGLCRVINTKLNDGYEYFIAEFGAAKKGDIEELMKMVKPDIGILLNIGVQHLETFKTKENIKIEKSKILNMLEDGNIGIYSSEYITENEITSNIKKINVASPKGYQIFNVKYNYQNTSFDVHYKNELILDVTTNLFGINNAKNLYMAITTAHTLGISVDEIKKVISTMRNYDSRGIITKVDNITVIDNSFNSNPEGAFNNINSLNNISCKKIIITPGFVELGELSLQSHKVFAKLIRDTFDDCILIDNKEIAPMKSHFDYYRYKYEVVNNFKQGFELAKSLYKAEEVIILIENDIPDIFVR